MKLIRALDQEANQQAECSDGERNQNAPEQRRRVWFHFPRPSMGNEPNTKRKGRLAPEETARPKQGRAGQMKKNPEVKPPRGQERRKRGDTAIIATSPNNGGNSVPFQLPHLD